MRFFYVANTVVFAAGLGFSAVFVWNRMPAGWLCDYGQEVSEDKKERGISMGFWGPLLALFFAGAGLISAVPEIFWENGRTGTGGRTFFVLAALWCLLLICFSDLHFQIIPDQFVLGLLLLGLAAAIWTAVLFAPSDGLSAAGWAGKTESAVLPLWGFLAVVRGAGRRVAGRFFSGLLCAAAFWALASAAALPGRLCRNGSSSREQEEEADFGWGDIKLLFGLAFFMGVPGGLFSLLFGSLVCGAHMGLLLLIRKVKARDTRPFGPYLCGAAALWMLWGQSGLPGA